MTNDTLIRGLEEISGRLIRAYDATDSERVVNALASAVWAIENAISEARRADQPSEVEG